MNSRDVVQEINQEQLAEENAGPLGALPTEKLVEIAAFLPSGTIQNLRQTCRFFRDHSLLKETMEKNMNPCQVITKGGGTFWLFKDGRIFGSGSNYFNALGFGKEVGSCFNPTLINLPSNRPIVKIVPGEGGFTFCFDTDGNCYFWGSNTCGQIGETDNSIQYAAKIMRLPHDQRLVDVVAGNTNSFLRDDKGLWYGLGDNDSGKLGISSQIRYTDKPIQINLPNGLGIKKIIPGGCQTFMQDIANNWFHCGYGGFVGKSTSAYASVYSPEIFSLPNDQPIVDIVTAHNSTFIRNQQGQWYVCGDNFYNQLGAISGVNKRNSLPITEIQLPNHKPINKIETSDAHTFIRDIDGQWFGCGNNASGQLLQQKTNHLGLTPIQLPNHKLIMEVHAGGNHTLLKDNEGNWYGCGRNQHGALGPQYMKKMETTLFQIDPSIFETANEKTEEMSLQARSRM